MVDLRLDEFYNGVAHVVRPGDKPEVCAMFDLREGWRTTLHNSSIRATLYSEQRSGVIVRGVSEIQDWVRASASGTERRAKRIILSDVLRAIRDGASETTPVQPEHAVPYFPAQKRTRVNAPQWTVRRPTQSRYPQIFV